MSSWLWLSLETSVSIQGRVLMSSSQSATGDGSGRRGAWKTRVLHQAPWWFGASHLLWGASASRFVKLLKLPCLSHNAATTSTTLPFVYLSHSPSHLSTHPWSIHPSIRPSITTTISILISLLSAFLMLPIFRATKFHFSKIIWNMPRALAKEFGLKK